MMKNRFVWLCLVLGFLFLKPSMLLSTDFKSIQESAASFYSKLAKFNPPWATYAGIHDYDSLMPDYSRKNVKAFRNYIHMELDNLYDIDTTGWSVDDKIDYCIFEIQLESMLSDLESLGNGQEITALTIPDCNQSLYYLIARPSLPFNQRSDAMLRRMQQMPDYLDKAKEHINQPDTITYNYTRILMWSTQRLIRAFSSIILDSLPNRAQEITSIRDKADWAIGSFVIYCKQKSGGHENSLAAGKERFDEMLSKLYFFDFDSDSAKNIAQSVYSYTDSVNKRLDTIIPYPDYIWGMAHDVVTTPPEDSSLEYCRAELDRIREFLDSNSVVSIPADLSECVFLNENRFGLSGFGSSGLFVEPGRLDKNQDVYCFSNFGMLTHWIGGDLPPDYFNWRFRLELVSEVIPGQYFQTQIALRNPSILRRMNEDLMASKGWELYIKEQLAQMGLMGEDPQCLYDIYKEIKEYALGAIMDINIHCEEINIDSVLVRMRDKFEYKDDAEFKIHFAAMHPGYYTAVLLGWYKFKDMREKAEGIEGDSFNLKAFHDRILSEGCIPPALVARKYGWE